VLTIILAEKDTERMNKEKRKIIYNNLAHFLNPTIFERGHIVHLKPCLIEKVREAYPDKKYSSYGKFAEHLNQ
ncbi:hypothetical protein M1146_06235, partial [Patescibacteria group bacterium]|nr:hypothetical protein [Patescibacteria group bacterium]